VPADAAVVAFQVLQPAHEREGIQVAVDDRGGVEEIRAFEAHGGHAIHRRHDDVAEARARNAQVRSPRAGGGRSGSTLLPRLRQARVVLTRGGVR
jgi:hypothetical protein